eukprot:scaffold109543_cov25-Prasinocladus_malaysianus.AAC.2
MSYLAPARSSRLISRAAIADAKHSGAQTTVLLDNMTLIAWHYGMPSHTLQWGNPQWRKIGKRRLACAMVDLGGMPSHATLPLTLFCGANRLLRRNGSFYLHDGIYADKNCLSDR